MQYFILATSIILSTIACGVSFLTYYKLSKIRLSVPDRQTCEPVASTVVTKESSEVDPLEKWKKLQNAFNLSGKTNGRSRTS